MAASGAVVKTGEGRGSTRVGLTSNIYAKSSMVCDVRYSGGYPTATGGGLGDREGLG
jgi:hypothetical protein